MWRYGSREAGMSMYASREAEERKGEVSAVKC
jgi:hypothetical protein